MPDVITQPRDIIADIPEYINSKEDSTNRSSPVLDTSKAIPTSIASNNENDVPDKDNKQDEDEKDSSSSPLIQTKYDAIVAPSENHPDQKEFKNNNNFSIILFSSIFALFSIVAILTTTFLLILLLIPTIIITSSIFTGAVFYYSSPYRKEAIEKKKVEHNKVLEESRTSGNDSEYNKWLNDQLKKLEKEKKSIDESRNDYNQYIENRTNFSHNMVQEITGYNSKSLNIFDKVQMNKNDNFNHIKQKLNAYLRKIDFLDKEAKLFENTKKEKIEKSPDTYNQTLKTIKEIIEKDLKLKQHLEKSQQELPKEIESAISENKKELDNLIEQYKYQKRSTFDTIKQTLQYCKDNEASKK